MDMYVMIVAVVGLVVTFGMPIIVVAIISTYKMRKNRLVHGTVLSLAEKGVPIPPELIVPPQAQVQSDLKIGVVMLAAGAGISLFFFEVHGPVSFGAVPALMGLGYIIAWKLEKSPQSGS